MHHCNAKINLPGFRNNALHQRRSSNAKISFSTLAAKKKKPHNVAKGEISRKRPLLREILTGIRSQCIAAVHGSLAEPTVVDYNEAQDKPEEFKKKDAIPEMTSTDSDGENHSTESTDPECALLPEANHARIAEVRVGVGNPEPHWQFDSSDNETQVPDKDSAAEAPAEALLQTHLLHAQNEKRQTYQQRTKHRPNGNLGFWAFVGDTLDNSAALPASPPWTTVLHSRHLGLPQAGTKI